MSNLHFTATIDAAKFNKTLEDIEKRIRGIQESANTSQPWFSAAKIIEASEVIGVLKEVAGSIIKVRAEFQQLEVSFGAMLKSKAEANTMMQDVVQMAAQSPFEFSAIADGAKQLIIFGANAQTATNDLKMLGDIAVGTGMPINDLAAAYGAMRKEGEASKDQLEELAGKGIPIYAELGKILKISTEDVKYFAEAGKVGFNDMQQAFISLTSNGGMFEGLMQQQAETVQGSLTKLSNAFGNMFNGILQEEESYLASAISGTADLVNNYEGVIDILEVVVATYGAYKTALMITEALQAASASNTLKNIKAWISLAGSVKNAGDAQALFNLTTKANPYILLATGLIAVIGYLAIFREELSDAEKAQQKLNDVKQQTDKELTGEIAKTQVLTAQIKNETLSREERNKALQQLIALSPEHLSSLTLENASTAAGTQAINGYIEAKRKQLELKNLEKELDESMQRQLDAKNLKNEMPWYQKMFYGAVYGANAGAKIAEGTIKDNAEIAKSEEAIQKAILDKIAATTKDASATAKANKEKNEGAKKTIEDYDKEIALNENLRKANSTNRKEAIKYEREINKLKRERAALTGENEIKEPFGSLAYWQAISKKAGDVLNKLNPLDKSKQADIARLQNQKLEADLKAEEASKLIAVKTSEQVFEEKRKQYEQYQQWVAMKGKASADKEYADLLQSGNSYQEYIGSKINNLEVKVSTGTATDKDREALIKLQKEDQRIFEQGLAEKKTQYELYNRWVTFAGKEAADAQFKDLLQSGASYEKYIEGKIGEIKTKQTSGTASTTALENLVAYQFTLETVTQSFEKYKQQITAAGEKTGTMTENLALLKEEQEKIGKSDPQKAGFIAEQIVETEKKRKDLIKDFLTENNLNEEKRLAIQKKYDDLRAGLDQEYADKKSEVYIKALEKINQKEREDLATLDERLRKLGESTKQELSIIINETNQRQIEAFIAKTQGELQKLREISSSGNKLSNTETQTYITLNKSIVDAQKALNNLKTERYQTLFGLLGKVGTELGRIEGSLGEIGKALVVATSKGKDFFDVIKATNQSTSLAKAAREAQKFADNQVGEAKETAIKAAKEIASEASSAAKGAQSSLVSLGISLVSEIVNSWVEQKRLNDELKRNQIKLQKQYNLLLIEEIRLNSIKSQNYVKKYKDIINDALTASTQAQDELNKLGNTLDRTLGVIVKRYPGFFGIGAMDFEVPITKVYPDLIKTIDGVRVLDTELAQTLIDSGTLSQQAIDLLNEGIKLSQIIVDSAQQINDVIEDLIGDIGGKLQSALVQAFESGADAALVFKQVVGEVIADATRKLMFSAIFKDAFDELAGEFKKSFSFGGDFDVADDLDRWQKKYGGLVETLETSDKVLADWLKQNGYDVGDTAGKVNSLSGQISTITEKTAGVLEGQFNAMRITQAQTLEVSRTQLLSLTEIAANTRYLKFLESIDKKLTKGDDSRSWGAVN